MALLLAYFTVFVLAASATATDQQGFLSIDCGLEDDGGYQDENQIVYVPDGTYVDGGVNQRVDSGLTPVSQRPLETLRYFPDGKRNCYALPTVTGLKYLVRLLFKYNNYDGKNSAPTFDLYLGVNRWASTYFSDDQVYEAVFMAWASWSPVCLVNTGNGTPFVSSVELRRMDALYPAVMANQSLAMNRRCNMGSNISITRYPDDVYDRYWWQMNPDPTWANLSTNSPIEMGSSFPSAPMSVLQTAVTPTRNHTVLSVITWQDTSEEYMVFLYFADFQSSELREFDGYASSVDQVVYSYTPSYLIGSIMYSDWFKANDGTYNITLTTTTNSKLPPILNAFEIYNLITHDNPATYSKDFDAIMSIKFEYEVNKNWTGDPCFPPELTWNGVKCRSVDGNITRITSLDLSNSNLHGSISNNFTLLTALEFLDLSGNQLTGPIPTSLCKNNGRTFNFSYNSNQNMCSGAISPSGSRNRTAILVISITVPVLLAAILFVAYLVWRAKRKPNVSLNDTPRVQELMGALGSRKNQWGQIQKPENRRLTYQELEKFTDNFKRLIGQGGFGHVYYGCLEDSTEVAVKMRSESSSHGLDQFFAEVQSLTKVHHKNLVSLVGFCWEKDHLALVYEYMSRGNLCDYLRGKTGAGETLNWVTRVRVVLEAAQGLDYLHKGCSLPIIHGDVKTNNILLGPNLKAKIADFGLSKSYHSDSQTHISATAAGSVGYIDPEYYYTGRLTESSDVYSFGIVLLEVATGEPPILSGQGHIVQRVKQKIVTGNINLVADACLRGAYDVSSMWKVIDTAMMCTTDTAAQRPTMAAVVVQLKESLALEEAHGNRGTMENIAGDASSLMSTFGPSAR